MKIMTLLYSVLLMGIMSYCTNSNVPSTPILGERIKEQWGTCDEENSVGSTISIEYWAPDITTIKSQLFSLTQEQLLSVVDSVKISQTPNINTQRDVAFQAFGASYQEAKSDFPDMPGCWEVNITGDTLYRSGKFITYEISKYSFTGGAHPNTTVSLHMFDLTSGKEISQSTFLRDKVALLPLVEDHFRANQQLTADANLIEAGYFLDNNDRFFLPAQMALTNNGLLCYYNPYEIAAYAYGPIEFTIPYSDLQGILAPEFQR